MITSITFSKNEILAYRLGLNYYDMGK